jgi:hypothetical protein
MTREEMLEQAVDRCLIGGNHIASQLINRYGADFCDQYPYTGEGPSQNGDVLFYDLWACWANIMRARDIAEHGVVNGDR